MEQVIYSGGGERERKDLPPVFPAPFAISSFKNKTPYAGRPSVLLTKKLVMRNSKNEREKTPVCSIFERERGGRGGEGGDSLPETSHKPHTPDILPTHSLERQIDKRRRKAPSARKETVTIAKQRSAKVPGGGCRFVCSFSPFPFFLPSAFSRRIMRVPLNIRRF